VIALLAACAEVPPPDEPAVACPPAGPTGLAVGDTVEDVALEDCSGSAVSPHDLCGAPALVASWYGWCPSCSDNADLARSLAADHPDLQVRVALVEDPLGAPADPDLCDAYVATWPSAAGVWIDPDRALEVYGTTDLVLVLAADGTITFLRETATEDAIVAAVEDVLAGG
jgi:hypothetical protein